MIEEPGVEIAHAGHSWAFIDKLEIFKLWTVDWPEQTRDFPSHTSLFTQHLHLDTVVIKPLEQRDIPLLFFMVPLLYSGPQLLVVTLSHDDQRQHLNSGEGRHNLRLESTAAGRE